MRNVTGIAIWVIALALIGCTRAPIESTVTPAAEQAGDSQIALECPPGERLCIGCNGNRFCAPRCTFPVCPAPVAPEHGETSTVAELTPVGEQCGGVICRPGLHCCNPTCNACTPRGVECSQESCN